MASSISITSHRSIGEETDRLNLEEIEKSAEQRSLNSTGGGNLNAEINLGGENLAMDRYKKILGLNVSQRNVGGLKTDKKKEAENAGQSLRRAWFFNRLEGRGVWSSAIYWRREERKLREGQISNVGLGPHPIYRAAILAPCGAGPIRYGAVWGHYATSWARPAPTPFQPGQKGQITARSGAKVVPIGCIVLHHGFILMLSKYVVQWDMFLWVLTVW